MSTSSRKGSKKNSSASGGFGFNPLESQHHFVITIPTGKTETKVAISEHFSWEENNEAKTNGAASEGAARLLGIDYRFCKGCLRCIESCPSGALAKEREADWLKEEQVDLWQEHAR